MTDQPESKTCQACQKTFTRRPAPLDSAFRWMRRKYCSVECARARVFAPPAPPQKAPTSSPGGCRTSGEDGVALAVGGPSAAGGSGAGAGGIGRER